MSYRAASFEQALKSAIALAEEGLKSNNPVDAYDALGNILKLSKDATRREGDKPDEPAGYADGSYMNRCGGCEHVFIGAKGAVLCYPCAKIAELRS